MKESSSLKNFTRGGQIILHNLRMVNQIINRVLIVSAIIFVAISISFTYLLAGYYHFYLLYQWLLANMLVLFNNKAMQTFIHLNGTVVRVYSQKIIDAEFIRTALHDLTVYSLIASGLSLFATTIIYLLIYKWLKKRGQEQSETKKIRGDDFASESEFNHILKKRKIKSDTKIGGIYLPKNFEIRHTFVHGTQGTGKSLLLRELLDEVRRRNDKAIIYDKGYTFIPQYAKSDDIVMNVFDERMPIWTIWNECKDFSDFDSFAAGLIPMPKYIQDPFWITGARLVFATAAWQMRHDKERSIFKLLKALLSEDMSYLTQLLKGTEAETFSSEKIAKTILGIKLMIAIHARYLKYLKEGKNNFSIKDWVKDDSNNNWIFFSSIADKHETLKPLITTWLDITVNALMSLPDSLERRVWIFLDELPTLNRVPCLLNTLAESRKFGGAVVIGVQNKSLLQEIYGIDGANAILDLAKSKFFLNSPSYNIANFVSQELGIQELEEVKEGISYSESAMRSGISISKQRYNRPVISASEIMNLEDLEFYARLGGGLPITKSKLIYKKRNLITEPFIQRKISENNFDELDKLIEKTIDTTPTEIQRIASLEVINEGAW